MAVLLGILGVSPAAPRQHAGADLSGLWRFNTEKSDRQGDAPLERPRPGYFTSPRRGGGSRAEPAADPTALMGLIRPVLQLLIRQNDSTITISDATGQLATYHTDGRKIREPQLVGDDIEITARWKEGLLTIERKLPDVGTVKETYSRDPSGKELLLLVKLSGARFPRGLEMRRVYDLTKEEP